MNTKFSKEKRIKRFWTRVTVRGKDECWEFNSDKIRFQSNGFKRTGTVWTDGKNIPAPRFSYELEHGKIPDEFNVCHSCDNPPCVNPNHLFLGTQSINMLDMIKKGRSRHRKGEQHHRAKLTETQVKAIRSDPRGAVKLSRAYGVGTSTITQIKNRTIWKHVS